MKKTVILGLFVILQTFVFLGCGKGNSNSTLYAQSSNDAQRIVGTWKGVDSDADDVGTVTFNANGTVTGYISGRYFVSNSILFIRTNRSVYSLSYYLSSDGRLLVLSGNISYSPHWLEKQ
jgi:hypothetical protein